MTTSTQTKADLTTIVEALDQRLFELTADATTASQEIAGLEALRQQALSILG